MTTGNKVKSLDYPFVGIDEVSTYVEDNNKYLQGDSALHNAARSIEKTALKLCNDHRLHQVEFKIEQDGSVYIDTLNDKALDCLLQSFKRHTGIIPADTKEIIEKILNSYQEKKIKCQSIN